MWFSECRDSFSNRGGNMKKTLQTKRRLRRTTWLWLLGGLAIISGLLYFDQIALLYVVSTAALTVLMIIVAFSNLRDDETVSDVATDEESIAVASHQVDVGLEISRRTQTANQGALE